MSFNSKTGGGADSTDPETWGPFAEALDAMTRRQHDGVGYVFAPDDPYAGVDLDGCRNKETGEIADWARPIIASFASFAEISPSGGGVHILIRASMPGGKGRKRKPYEAYSQERFFTVSGVHLEGTPATIEERQNELEAFLAHYLPHCRAATAAPTQRMCGPEPLNIDDEDLLMRARNNPDLVKAARFQRLFDAGDTAGYTSQSEADAALCNDLAYMCGPHAEERVATLFRRSALYRNKVDREDYLARTIALAYAGRTAFYTPRTVEKSTKKDSIENTALALSANVPAVPDALDALDADDVNQPDDLRAALARIRELEHENVALRQSVISMNGKLQDIRNIIDADGLQVAPLEKVLEIDLLLHTIWPSHAGRRDPEGFTPILIETPRDRETGEKVKGVVGLADKHGVSRSTISKALDNLHIFGGCRVKQTAPEMGPNGTFRSRVLVAPPVHLQPKEWVRPGGPRKQMGGARPGAGRKAKCSTPGCDGELVERRGVETKEHEFVEMRCTGICGEVRRHYTGIVTTLGSRYYAPGASENQVITDALEATGSQVIPDAGATNDTAGGETVPPPTCGCIHSAHN